MTSNLARQVPRIERHLLSGRGLLDGEQVSTSEECLDLVHAAKE
jgi:hypothetical protein